MNEYPRPTGPDPQLPQAPQTSGTYPNQPQNQYGQNQAVNPQISQPYVQNSVHQAAPSPSTPPESAVKPKMSILLLSVLILAILMPILRVIEYGVMASMVNTLIEALRQSLGESAYQQFIAKPEFYELRDMQVGLVGRFCFWYFLQHHLHFFRNFYFPGIQLGAYCSDGFYSVEYALSHAFPDGLDRRLQRVCQFYGFGGSSGSSFRTCHHLYLHFGGGSSAPDSDVAAARE